MFHFGFSEEELDEILFGILTDGIDLESRKKSRFEEQINDNFTTRTIRYLIALTNAADGAIDGLILCPGEELGKNFTDVAEKSFKCQRSIPMSFFEEFKGQVVFNP